MSDDSIMAPYEKKLKKELGLLRMHGKPRGYTEEQHQVLDAIHRIGFLHREIGTPDPRQWFQNMAQQSEWRAPEWMPEEEAGLLQYLIETPDQREAYLQVYDGMQEFLEGFIETDSYE